MKNIISISGGRTSAYLALLAEKLSMDAEYIFMDTGAEHPETYIFLKKVMREFDIKITCLRANINPVLGVASSYTVIDIDDCKFDLRPWASMMSKYGTPYVHGAFCTDRLKLVPYTKYCNDKYGKGNYLSWLGIRVDETKRLKKRKGYKYLADICNFTKKDILSFWQSQSFDLQIPEHLGNCVFCIKKGINKIALSIKDEPELYDMFLNCLKNKSVRHVVCRKSPSLMMYRGLNTLEQIKNTYDDLTRDEIFSSLRGQKTLDSECSESCEIFSSSK